MNKTEKYNPFKTPEDYFEGFTDKVMGRLIEEKILMPKTDNQTNGFKVPEGYFESLNEKILTKVNNEIKVVKLHPYRTYYMVAASIAAMLILVLGIDRGTTREISFDGLASSDIEKYFETNDLDLTTLEIAEVFPIDGMTIGDILNNQLNEENVIDYLNNNIERIDEFNLETDE